MTQLKWRTKDGEEIKIKDMSSQHIRNCIKGIEKNKIQVGRIIDIGYTADGDGDGIIYDTISLKKYYLQVFKNELRKRQNMEG